MSALLTTDHCSESTLPSITQLYLHVVLQYIVMKWIVLNVFLCVLIYHTFFISCLESKTREDSVPEGDGPPTQLSLGVTSSKSLVYVTVNGQTVGTDHLILFTFIVQFKKKNTLVFSLCCVLFLDKDRTKIKVCLFVIFRFIKMMILMSTGESIYLSWTRLL